VAKLDGVLAQQESETTNLAGVKTTGKRFALPKLVTLWMPFSVNLLASLGVVVKAGLVA
jgi:hypothetical protein